MVASVLLSDPEKHRGRVEVVAGRQVLWARRKQHDKVLMGLKRDRRAGFMGGTVGDDRAVGFDPVVHEDVPGGLPVEVMLLPEQVPSLLEVAQAVWVIRQPVVVQ